MSRIGSRSRVVFRAIRTRMGGARRRAETPQSVLLAHQLLLGDTLMTTALVAKLRARFPAARLAMLMPQAFIPLYANRPYGLEAIPFSPRNPDSLDSALRMSPTGWDWTLLPGDNRFSWLAQAMGARWIGGWRDDSPAHKNWMVDEAFPWPEAAAALGDLWAEMIDGSPCEYSPGHWPEPPCAAYPRPAEPYAVLHIGASNPKKFWPAKSWQAVAQGLQALGFTVVLSAGKGEESLTRAVDPGGRYQSFAGQLDLAQLFSLLREAALLIAPDTGVAHLGKVTGTPTLALFGRGPTVVYGRGHFWSRMPFRATVLAELPARPQSTLFRRPFSWLPAASAETHTLTDIRYGSGPDFVVQQVSEIIKEN